MKKLLSLLLALCLCAALMVPAVAEDKGAYVLMNIPYADFYAAESDVAVDAVTSATLMKPRAGALVGGSYHVDPEGSDISGVIFPVYVEDVSALASLGGVEITDCLAENVTVTAGDNCFWIGGITGYAGGYPDAQYGMPVTVFTNCATKNVTVTAGENADGIGDIVGAGFYNEQVAQSMGAPFDQPTQFELVDCTADTAAEEPAA